MLNLIEHGAIRELRIDRAPANALNPALLAALNQALEQAYDNDEVRAVIISGRPGLFSAGLDVPELLGLNREQLGAAWRDLFSVARRLATAPKLTVAALTGHSPAGGAVVAVCCDYRVMAEGEFRIGLNEVQVGLAVPGVIVGALRRLVGHRLAERLLVEGRMLTASEALGAGFVDELAAVDDVIPAALRWLHKHLALPPKALELTRREARADLAGLFAGFGESHIEALVDGWFAEESQTVLRKLVERLLKRG